MKKFFLICLLVILPLQFSYAAVSCHCSNEQSTSSQKIKVAVSNPDLNGKSESSDGGMMHCGCLGHCHHFGTVIFQAYSTPFVLAESDAITISGDEFYQSHISNGLERPNWWFAV